MKYYETTCAEYIAQSKRIDIHPELEQLSKSMPVSLNQMGNIIFYGPSGAGKYTQFLRFVEKYAFNTANEKLIPGSKIEDANGAPLRMTEYGQDILSHHRPALGLKTEKMTAMTEKQKYEYHISDIHYEIDLALLGCESKKLWNECFFQIVDIVSAKTSKCGIILCKNFQSIHSELLEVFYSYMQHCRALNIHIVFAILTEHVSFIPNRILQCCKLIPVKRPATEFYYSVSKDFCVGDKETRRNHSHKSFLQQINPTPNTFASPFQSMGMSNSQRPSIEPIVPEYIWNLKETHSIVNAEKIPKDVFNIVCDNIIAKMVQHETLDIISLRDNLYDILLYGLDVTECLWYILYYFVETQELNICALDSQNYEKGGKDREDVLLEIMDKIDSFLKFYNNNYRPIYHLESIFIYLITKIYRYPSITNSK
jgi:hypothetical protein